MEKRLISVVMGVRNGASELPETLESVLAQQGVEFEFIIVDDGSTDDSSRILDEYARRDLRIRLLSQPRLGLTRALILGCDQARGRYIARQDVGDIARPGRLEKQATVLDTQATVVLVGCTYRMVTDRGELLYEGMTALDDELMTQKLRQAAAEATGPHHGTVMFRRDAYLRAGGYRSSFYFAQDMDLWLRLVEHGSFMILPEALCELRFSVDSISGLNRPEQQHLKALALQATRLRQQGKPEDPVLQQAAAIRPLARKNSRLQHRRKRAAGAYFIGSCLAARHEPAAAHYLRLAVREYPLHWRAWLKLGRSLLA